MKSMKKMILAGVITCLSLFLFACANGKKGTESAEDMDLTLEHAEFINNNSNMELTFLEVIKDDPDYKIGGDSILSVSSEDGIVNGDAYHYPEKSAEVRVTKVYIEQKSEYDILGIKVGDDFEKAKTLAEKAGFVFEKEFTNQMEKEVTLYSYKWGNIFLTLNVDGSGQIVQILLAAG